MEGRLAGHELECHAAERVDVGAMVDVGVAGGLLGRHVGRRADGRAKRRERFAFAAIARGTQGLGDAEVGHDCGASREEHVVRLDVAMDDATLVGVLERARDVAEDANGVGDRERRLLRKAKSKRLALHERHRVVRQAVDVTGGEHGDDVRLLERSGHPDLPLEPVGADAGGELGREHLDDDASAEAHFVSDEDARHASTTEFTLEGVGAAKRCLNLILKVFHWRQR